MATALTVEIVNGAKQAVANYKSDADGIFNELQNAITTLVSAEFQGEGAEGYKTFFDTKVKPALTDNLTAEGGSLTANLNTLLDVVQELISTVDPDLGKSNTSI